MANSINKDTTLDELMEIAERTVAELDENEDFIVKSLFRGFEWNRLPIKTRTVLGSSFLSRVNAGKISVVANGKSSQNQQIYTKQAQ